MACGFFAQTGDGSVYSEKGKGFGSFEGVGFLSRLLALCHSLLDLLVPAGRCVPCNLAASSEWLGGGRSLIVCSVILRLSWG